MREQMRKWSVPWVCLTLVACGTAPEPEVASAPVSAPQATAPSTAKWAGPIGFACPPSPVDGSVWTYPVEGIGTHPGQTFPDFPLGAGYLNLTGAPNDTSKGKIPLSMHDLYCSGFKLAWVSVGTVICTRFELPDLEVIQKTWLPKGGMLFVVIDPAGWAPENIAGLNAPFDYSIGILGPPDSLYLALGLKVMPTNFIIRLSDMTVVDAFEGPVQKGDPLLREFEDALDQIQ